MRARELALDNLLHARALLRTAIGGLALVLLAGCSDGRPQPQALLREINAAPRKVVPTPRGPPAPAPQAYFGAGVSQPVCAAGAEAQAARGPALECATETRRASASRSSDSPSERFAWRVSWSGAARSSPWCSHRKAASRGSSWAAISAETTVGWCVSAKLASTSSRSCRTGPGRGWNVVDACSQRVTNERMQGLANDATTKGP